MSGHESSCPSIDVPAPWQCHGEAFCFFGYISSKTGEYPPPAAFGSTESASSFSDASATGDYHGGLTSLMLIRYKQTPVGPYDELIWIPGAFTVPQTGKKKLRVTRIYVSTKQSVYNGRKNWNVPKAVAHFEFTPNPNATSPKHLPYTKISLSNADDPERPFFAINITSSRFLSKPRFPFKSTRIPLDLGLVQPPLPESPTCYEDAEVGTNHWLAINPVMTGKGGLIWGDGGLEGGRYGDDVEMPNVSPWKMGLWLENFKLESPIGEEIMEDKKAD